MRREPKWIHKKALLLLHQESLAEFGGAPGISDEGLLDSALARPRNLLTYDSRCTLEEMAAAYGFGIIKNHAFVDGNKQAGFLSVALFLSINSSELRAGQVDAIETFFAVAAGKMNEKRLAEWLAQNTVKAGRKH